MLASQVFFTGQMELFAFYLFSYVLMSHRFARLFIISSLLVIYATMAISCTSSESSE